MNRRFVTLSVALAGFVVVGAGCSIKSGSRLSWAEQGEIGWTPGAAYPEAPRADVHEDFFGTDVYDPYRWMEDLDSDQVQRWIADENALSFPYLASLPRRDAIKDRITELWNYERFGAPSAHGKHYFYSFNSGLMNQSIIYVADSLDAQPTVLLDPNGFSEDGTVSLASSSISPDGNIIAYAKSDGGSDFRDWFFRDANTGKDLTDTLTFTKFTGLSWTPDESGVYYSRYPEGDDGMGDDSKQVSVYYHAIGTPQSADPLVFDLTGAPQHRGLDPNPYADVTEDGRYIVISVSAGYFENQVFFIDRENAAAGAQPIVDEWKALYGFLGNDGPMFYFETTADAPNSRVVKIDITEEMPRWRDVVPEREQALQGSSYVGGRIIAQYLEDAKSLVSIYETDGTHVRDVALPGIGSAGGFGGRADSTETFYTFSGFTTPTTSYRYDVATDESTLFKSPTVNIDLTQFETRQVFYASKDGTQIPMFITHKKGIKLDGTNPTLLYGYGGFNVSLTPVYSTSRMVWMEMGGVLAIPNLRGGGEYGEAWHLAGVKGNKQNVFDDFIAAAEWLIANDYTSTPRLAIQGGSNGGLLIGACMTQRPDLFGACLPAVGVLDMIRYHLPSANARNWSTDYGLSENEDEFRWQIAYSPVHNVVEGTVYPPTLVTTADHDDRVVPWHSFKFAAALQHAQAGSAPVLIRIETRAGHGAGKPTWMRIEEIADSWAFLADALRMN
jgi:prolyl oligopeptidase